MPMLKKSIAFVPAKESTLTRVGGGSNLPSKKEWPTDENGNPMVFLLQIDLATLPKNEFKLPTKGLLQFYTSPTSEFYGMSSDYFDDYTLESLIHGSEVRVLHWEELGEENPGRVIAQPDEPDYTPLNTTKKGQYFEPKLVEVDDDNGDEWEFRIGGQPYFTQDDSIMEELDGYFPLLNYPGTEYAMWGDSGSASWWINEKDLNKEDFSEVFLYWDCY